MFGTQRCPTCKTPLSRDVLNGLCPRCILAAAMDDHAEESTGPWLGRKDGPCEPPTVLEMKAQFPHLEVTELIGHGGMGSVYRARQPGLDRVVAIKVLPAERGRGSEFAERFSREAKMLAMLNHPNIVAVYDYGQRGDLCYIVMEHVDGTNLRHQIQTGQMRSEEALRIVSQIGGAMQYAHEQGVIHRDIKPENILIDLKGRVKIADFGLAKLINKNVQIDHLTRTQQVMGTLRYMAPEQIERTRDVDHRADIYSLGVVMYELLTHELPLGRFPLPSEKHGLDRRIDDVVLKALDKSPEKRYQHAGEIKEDLDAILGRKSVEWISLPRKPWLRQLNDLPLIVRIPIIVLAMILGIIVLTGGITIVPFFVMGIVGYSVYRFTRRSKASRRALDSFDGVRMGAEVHRRLRKTPGLIRFIWHYNPIAIAFRLLFNRILWIFLWAVLCIGLYIGMWFPAWQFAGKPSIAPPEHRPGLIDEWAWPYSGIASSSVRITPVKPYYLSLTISRDIDGTWQGFRDATYVSTAHQTKSDQIAIVLERLDRQKFTLLVDVSDDNSFAYRTPEGRVVAQPGPLDTELVKRWLIVVLVDEVPEAELQPHAVAIFEVVDFATRKVPYTYDPTNVVKGRNATSKGRMAKVLATTIYRNYSKNYKDHPFKDWVGTQNVNIEEDKPIVPIGAGVMLGTFFLGYWGIRWVSRYRSKAPPVLNEVTSSMA